MCPFCIGTAVWIAVSAVTAGGVSTLAVAKFRNKKTHEHEEGGTNEQQATKQ
jgi:hypothetical protein